MVISVAVRLSQGFKFGTKSGPLNFRALPTTLFGAQVALEDDYDESSKASGKDGLEISRLEIDKEIVSALAKKGITKLFPIQRAVLEPAMQGRDMIGRARTGTGKTLAFGIPILDKIIRFNAKYGVGGILWAWLWLRQESSRGRLTSSSTRQYLAWILFVCMVVRPLETK